MFGSLDSSRKQARQLTLYVSATTVAGMFVQKFCGCAPRCLSLWEFGQIKRQCATAHGFSSLSAKRRTPVHQVRESNSVGQQCWKPPDCASTMTERLPLLQPSIPEWLTKSTDSTAKREQHGLCAASAHDSRIHLRQHCEEGSENPRHMTPASSWLG